MKQSWAKYIVGCFFITAFLFNSIVPDIMILSGHVAGKMVSESLAAQEDVKTERSTEESQHDPRSEYVPFVQASFYIYPEPVFIIDNIIPQNIPYLHTVTLPVPTPPPDVTIV